MGRRKFDTPVSNFLAVGSCDRAAARELQRAALIAARELHLRLKWYGRELQLTLRELRQKFDFSLKLCYNI